MASCWLNESETSATLYYGHSTRRKIDATNPPSWIELQGPDEQDCCPTVANDGDGFRVVVGIGAVQCWVRSMADDLCPCPPKSAYGPIHAIYGSECLLLATFSVDCVICACDKARKACSRHGWCCDFDDVVGCLAVT